MTYTTADLKRMFAGHPAALQIIEEQIGDVGTDRPRAYWHPWGCSPLTPATPDTIFDELAALDMPLSKAEIRQVFQRELVFGTSADSFRLRFPRAALPREYPVSRFRGTDIGWPVTDGRLVRKGGGVALILEYDGDALEAFVAGGLVALHKYGGRLPVGSVEFLTPTGLGVRSLPMTCSFPRGA